MVREKIDCDTSCRQRSAMLRAVLCTLLFAFLSFSAATPAPAQPVSRQRLSLSGLTFNPAAITGGARSTGTVAISEAAPSGGVSISLTSSNPSVTVPATVTISAGKSAGTFILTCVGVATAENVQVKATLNGNSLSKSLTVNPAVFTSFTFVPGTLTGGNGSMGTVTLNGPAPSAGLSVTLTSSNTSAATVPASFTIAGAATSGTFNVSSFPVSASTPVTITAKLPSGTTSSAGLTVAPPVVTLLSFNPASVVSGLTTTGRVGLNGNAPSGGFIVSLTSSNSAAFPVPATLLVPANMSSQTFTVIAAAVAGSMPVTVTATTGSIAATGNVTVLPSFALTGLTFSPPAVTGGSSSMGTVTLSQPAPTGGTGVFLTSADPSVSVPASFTIPAGSSSQTFAATTVGVAAVKTVQVTAAISTGNLSGSLTVNPASLTSFSLSRSSLTGGNNSVGTVTLSGAAPASGLNVSLTSNNTSAATVPATLMIAAGASSGSFNVTTLAVTAVASVNITATLPSGANLTAR